MDETSTFFLFEIGGNDDITLEPIDSAGDTIGDYSLTISSYGSVDFTAARPNRSTGGVATNPAQTFGVSFVISDFSGTGDLSDFAGFAYDGLNGSGAGDDADLVLLGGTVIPEPASLAGLGLLGLLTLRRRR